MLDILILCTGNSARSILAEALFNAHAGGRLRAHSAGSDPTGTPHPLALDLLARRGHDTRGLSSKSWDRFAAPDAPRLDAVITVCDHAAGQVCPIWTGAPVSAHWGLPDPAAETDPEAARAAFAATYDALDTRITRFLDALDGSTPDALNHAFAQVPA
ncbi:arsenate reductase ArsC [Maricaulis sp. CAU 1757]